ncbi:IPExxxVDY family protein [Mariniflexile ostreae]|uniref:IPExxxVDY family protein n=1 Tax=Mariniflexile ostreae TaxID=1520892 RepID=A0ABV5FCM6_9FLAO
MAIHKLILDDVFDEVPCTLIAIHCSLEDYRLAYLLNKNLKISLKRRSKDLDYFNDKSTYAIFEWEDCKQLITWSLVSNTSKNKILSETAMGSLFETAEQISQTSYLIPENKSVNYFLKIDSPLEFTEEKQLLKTILDSSQITTAYSIDASQLKSKDNLIFN